MKNQVSKIFSQYSVTWIEYKHTKYTILYTSCKGFCLERVLFWIYCSYLSVSLHYADHHLYWPILSYRYTRCRISRWYYMDDTRTDRQSLQQGVIWDISTYLQYIPRWRAPDGIYEPRWSYFQNSWNTGAKTKNTLKKPKKYYNLQVIIAVGFKVNSPQATEFRTWANSIIDEYSRLWYALDDTRLKWENTIFSDKRDYDGLMERVRAIRFDERNIYEKIKDLFTTASDYDGSSERAVEFFQTIQNKFHYAIVGMTSPEIPLERASSIVILFD